MFVSHTTLDWYVICSFSRAVFIIKATAGQLSESSQKKTLCCHFGMNNTLCLQSILEAFEEKKHRGSFVEKSVRSWPEEVSSCHLRPCVSIEMNGHMRLLPHNCTLYCDSTHVVHALMTSSPRSTQVRTWHTFDVFRVFCLPSHWALAEKEARHFARTCLQKVFVCWTEEPMRWRTTGEEVGLQTVMFERKHCVHTWLATGFWEPKPGRWSHTISFFFVLIVFDIDFLLLLLLLLLL